MNVFEKARLQRSNIVKSSAALDDKDASLTPELFAQLRYNGELIKEGTRVNWNGTVKKAQVDLWDEEMYNPDNAPTLWADIGYKDGIRIIPDVITATTAFSMDEPGWWKDHVYISKVESNVWTPEQNPDGWVLRETGVEDES